MGALELIADFARPSTVASPGVRRRRVGLVAGQAGEGAAPTGQGAAPAGQDVAPASQDVAPAHGTSPTRLDQPGGVVT